MPKSSRFPFATPYGRFSEDGTAFVITRPDTPRPWVNVICAGTYGVVVSQGGSGYSWLHHASLNRITRWSQDLIRDDWGRYIYLRDEHSGRFWSAGWQPVRAEPDRYECVHGIGYTRITSVNDGIETRWLTFVPPGEPLEVWRLEVTNLGRSPRSLSVWTYLEWNLGEGPDSHREFHRTFIETSFHDKRQVILAGKRLSPLKNAKGHEWNRNWDWTAWHGVDRPTRAVSGDKQAFLGKYGSLGAPAALVEGRYVGPTTHRWDDGVASLCVRLKLAPGESQSAVFTVGAADATGTALRKARRFRAAAAADAAWKHTGSFWEKYLSAFRVETPDPSFDVLANVWLKYQALSARLWARTAYYQTGGAYGFRDQLQDSQIFLPLEPEGTRKQIHLHAAHQFTDGTVYHWWHPLLETGHPSEFSDDLLWLPFVMTSYLKETANWRLLREEVPFARRQGERAPGRASLYEHGWRAIERALSRLSPRGLPLIGEADWNDGLNAVGREGRGESIWMAHFLVGILRDWTELIAHAVGAGAVPAAEKTRAARYRKAAARLKAAVNRHGWDGRWFLGATCDDGTPLGSARNREGRIFLNCQTWAILNDVVDSPSRRASLLKEMERQLYGPHGPLLLTPAYTVPDDKVGYLTRYSPGTRENGGIYMHAAVWALQMECFLGRADKAAELYRRISPVLRGAADPELYRCEPYVTPGNVDGPESPVPGRGGWTWYTGSAAWLYRVLTEWVLGIRPQWGGLLVRPCLPPDWKQARARRTFRGGRYDIHFRRDRRVARGVTEVALDGRPVAGGLLLPAPGEEHEVVVRVGPA